MDESAQERACECGRPAKMVADPKVPVEFDERMNEYHLVRDGARTIMRYCFWCGGRLPESKRGTFFTAPNKAEKDEVFLLLRDAKSLDDVFRILGPPDATVDAPGGMSGRGISVHWKKMHKYSTRWKSLVLEVPDLPDGHRHWHIGGHYLGAPENTTEDKQS